MRGETYKLAMRGIVCFYFGGGKGDGKKQKKKKPKKIGISQLGTRGRIPKKGGKQGEEGNKQL